MDPTNKIDPHIHSVACMDSLHIFLYPKHVKQFLTSISYVVRKPKLPVNLADNSYVGMSRRDLLATGVPLTDPAYREDSLQVSNILSS